MKLLGYIVFSNVPYAVYSDTVPTMTEFWEHHLRVYEGQAMCISPHVRLVEVGEEGSPTVLPPDLSPSIHGD